MKNYIELLKKIKSQGAVKASARTNMPSTYSLFGENLKFNLENGLPLLTTKKVSYKNIITELLWFLKGDTNIKYLLDYNCNIWNEDAYNYYSKLCIRDNIEKIDFKKFIELIKEGALPDKLPSNYIFGDCGEQYGKLWRNYGTKGIDQIENLINNLKTNPYSRKHVLTSWNPETLEDMALNACHAITQFNCRPISIKKRYELYIIKTGKHIDSLNYNSKAYNFNTPVRHSRDGITEKNNKHTKYPFRDYAEYNSNISYLEEEKIFDEARIPKFYLDCNMYQRSADAFLGVPYNITSYSILTYLLCEMLNMQPGVFTHFFGDVHIYYDHLDVINIQIERTPEKLPTLSFSESFYALLETDNIKHILDNLDHGMIKINSYLCHPRLYGKLSTGLK